MKARCTKKPGHQHHKTFITTAHVVEVWEVDENGDWLDTRESLEVAAKPNAGNTWTCSFCGSRAEVTDD